MVIGADSYVHGSLLINRFIRETCNQSSHMPALASARIMVILKNRLTPVPTIHRMINRALRTQRAAFSAYALRARKNQ